MACKIIYKGKALPEEEAKIEINNDVVDDLNEQAVGKSIINSALLTDEEINQQITDLNKFKTVIENNYFKLEDNISVSSLVINKHIKNAPASLGKVKIDSKWRTKEEAKKQVEENLKQRKLFSKLKRNFGITEEQLNLIENVSADKVISSAEDLINAIESKLLSLNSLVLNSKKSKSATLQQKEQAQQLYSQYLNSLNKPNTNPILQGNQQEQVKKFTELQERLNNKEFLEGAKNAFESSEELQNVYYEAVRFNKTLEFYEGDNLKIDDKTYTISEKISSKELAKRNGLTISSNIPVYIVNEPLGLRKGGYDTVNNIIILSKNSDKETIHHELIHSVEYNLDKKEIEPLYQKVKNTITEDSFNDFVSWNFKKSISEFIADALSKKVFRDALKKEGLLEEIDNTLSVYSQQLSPQQKQDALNAYTDYIARVSLGILKNPSSGGYNYTSQAKDIVYHGTDKEFTEFVKGKEIIPKGKTKGGIWFTDFDNADWVYKEEGGKVVAALINLKNPIEYSTDRFFDEQYGDNLPTKPLKEGQWKDVQKLLDNKNGDGLLLDIFDATTAGDIGEFTKQQVVFEPEQIHILGSKQDIEGFKDFVQGKQFQKLTSEEKVKTIEQVTKEHRSITALKDLAAKLAHSIGGKVEFVNRTDVDWKGYNQGMTSVLNEAYMTPDTPFHEILAHPIIRAIKKKMHSFEINGVAYGQMDKYGNIGKGEYFKEREEISKEEFEKLRPTTLYQSLLKELETSETGRKVFEQVKRDYVYKNFTDFDDIIDISKDFKIVPDAGDTDKGKYYLTNDAGENFGNYNLEEIVNKFPEYFKPIAYTLEEQQEEAVVQLLGLMAADKLDKIKDKNLISLLKELLLQMSEYIKSLFTTKEIRISELNVSNLEFLTDKKIEEFIKSGKIKKEC